MDSFIYLLLGLLIGFLIGFVIHFIFVVRERKRVSAYFRFITDPKTGEQYIGVTWSDYVNDIYRKRFVIAEVIREETHK